MSRALALARKARQLGEVPVGAVIVDHVTDEVISECHNLCEGSCNPLAHAELLAITHACEVKQSKTLNTCYIYITMEPCAMCATAISYARISRIYYGAADVKFGAIENGFRIFYQDHCSLYKPDIHSGILAEESRALLQSFFKDLRALKTSYQPPC
jgi:cytosine deaminase